MYQLVEKYKFSCFGLIVVVVVELGNPTTKRFSEMICVKCRREAPDHKYCGHCGAIQVTPAEGVKAVLQVVFILAAIWFWGPELWQMFTGKNFQNADSKTIVKQVEYKVAGTIKSASVTFTNESGGTEQKEIRVPWTLTFPGTKGKFVYLSAQKNTEAGTVKVAITLDGTTLQSAEANVPYGIASASGSVQ